MQTIPSVTDGASPLCLKEREQSIITTGKSKPRINCVDDSLAGAVSQRACVYCGARVVLNPITDAVHLVHGPIGCASYTWDIRGSLSSGSEMYRNSFSTDLKERDVIFGGEKKLALCIDEIVEKYHPPAIFVYATCVAGIIGDDIIAVCKSASSRHGIDVIPVESSGFISGNKIIGYRVAGNALMKLLTPKEGEVIEKTKKVNFLGEYNLGGEKWLIERYLRELGIEINVACTGDSTVASIKQILGGFLNLVQCTGSMHFIARMLEENYHTPYIHVNFFGAYNTSDSLRRIARFYNEPRMIERAEKLIYRENERIKPVIQHYRQKLTGKRAAIYVGGAYKALAIIRQLRELGMEIVFCGTQTGRPDDYEQIHGMLQPGSVIADDANPAEIERFLIEKKVDLMAGGIKERVLAYKLGIGFVDHNHDRKDCLAGFDGAVNFAHEVFVTACSPVWKSIRNRPSWEVAHV